MKRIDESIIERYIRFPDTLDEHTMRAVEDLLDTDALAREIAEFYRELDADLETCEECVSEAVVKRVLEQEPFEGDRLPPEILAKVRRRVRRHGKVRLEKASWRSKNDIPGTDSSCERTDLPLKKR